MTDPCARMAHVRRPREGRPTEAHGPGERHRVETLLSLLPAGTAEVLEVGCGDGLVLGGLRSRGIRVVGLDVSPEALAWIPAPRLNASAAALPFRDGAFDLVLLADVVEHLPGGIYEAALAEAARVAGRHLLINAPDRENLAAEATRCPACRREFHPSWHLRSLSVEALARALPGFRLVRVRATGGTSSRSLAGLRRLQRRLGTFPALREAVCPACGTVFSRAGSRFSPAGRLCQAAVGAWDVLRGLAGTRDAEFAVLFERRSP